MQRVLVRRNYNTVNFAVEGLQIRVLARNLLVYHQADFLRQRKERERSSCHDGRVRDSSPRTASVNCWSAGLNQVWRSTAAVERRTTVENSVERVCVSGGVKCVYISGRVERVYIPGGVERV